MTAHLPPSLLALFAPRPPIPFMTPIEKKASLPPYVGIGEYVKYFEDPNAPETIQQLQHEKQLKQQQHPNKIIVPFIPFETKKQRKLRIAKEKIRQHLERMDDVVKKWEPSKDSKSTSDPYKTLVVARLNYSTSEHKLKREFEMYGPVKKVRIVLDKDGKPRGYAFVEFERERDMKVAYKQADGKKIDGRRVVVDYERARTSRSWKPRRFGGGLGSTRVGSDELNQKYSGREPPTREEAREEGERDKEKPREKDYKDKDRGREKDKPREKHHRERSRERSKERKEKH